VLTIKDLETGYGKKQVIYGLSLEAQAGQIVAIIGPNGSGKSTILKTVHGLLPVWRGDIYFDGVRNNGASPAKNVVNGITFAPQGNRVFDELSVKENLEVGGFHLKKKQCKDRIEEVLVLFPVLRQRFRDSAGKLSGGEQQMLALARSLIPKPKLLMLDEPSLGLSPKLVGTVFDKIVEVNQQAGVTLLIVEQKVREVLEICHHVYSIRLGKTAFSGPPHELKNNRDRLRDLFL